MATTPSQAWTVARNQAHHWPQPGFVLRCVLAGIAVLICYQFHWDWLRYFTSEANLRLDSLLGVHLQRITFDTVLCNGQPYRYVIACTFADVWCGALAFIWNLHRTTRDNLMILGGFTIALFVFNIARLSFSDFLCAHGASWNLGHNVVGGICYFVVWVFLQRNLRTQADQKAQPSPYSRA